MVSHSLNLFWFADVYPTVSHKNCPKKKKKLGTRVLEESLDPIFMSWFTTGIKIILDYIWYNLGGLSMSMEAYYQDGEGQLQ